MLKSIRIGAESFHKLIESDSYYVDKTSFIKTVFQDNTADVMLITRPRRFGKTLTMSTFHDFLALDPKNPSDVSRQKKWFKDTKIFEDKEFCAKYMGKFPVIFISLKSVSGNDFMGAYQQLGSTIYKMLCQFDYLAESNKLKDDAINDFKRLKNETYLCDPENKNAVKNALERLCYWLSIHHEINPILLIDEYDVPIAKAAHYGYYDDMIDIISPFLSNALKTNMYLGRAVLTGCLRAAKESIFTGLNNLQICSVLDTGDDDISKGIGFTRKQTQDVLSYYGLSDFYEEVRKNYDGYYFGTIHMYCPWDVMSFCYSNYKKIGVENKIITADNYWINTSGNDVIEEFMGFINSDDVEKMQNLLDGESITTEVRTSLCYGDLKNHDVKDFWTLMLYTGYFTFDPQYRSAKKYEYRLYIPNEEIKDCFKSKIMDFFETNPDMKNNTGELVKGLFKGNAETVENSLNGLLAKYVSIRDFSTKAPKENYYHGFMNGLLVNDISLIKEHKSNFESGDGYSDLILLSSSRDMISILELKIANQELDDRVSISEKAIDQIIKTRYADSFMGNKTIKSVYAFGICFYKKSCSVVCKKLK